jgi:hypothetical protein
MKAIARLVKNKRGVTLVELIASMIMLTFITFSVFAIMAPILRVYTQAGDVAEVNALLDNVANEMIGTIRNAAAEIDEDDLFVVFGRNNDGMVFTLHGFYGSGLITTEYSVDNNGVLLKNGVPFFSKAFYRGYSVSFSVSLSNTPSVNETSYILTMTITSDRDATRFISRDYAVVPLVLNQYN